MLGKLLVFCGISILSLGINNTLWAAPSTFEVGQITLPAVTNNAFTSFTFTVPFASGVTPNVFAMTTEDGSDPCTVRIQNVTNTGFDAVCLEPESEDGTHPGMVVDFIAIVDGITSVPINGGGTVSFESGCLETNIQIYNTSVTGGGVPRCTNCSGPTSYITQNFTTSFTNTPALLTQIQTTNNANPNVMTDPVFIDTGVRSVNSNSFQVSNDQMEAGNGPLANNERICYLATEIDTTTPCKDLNFSTLNGPASVMFQPINSGNVVDGWSNGCNAGEGVSFAAGCFTSTPIAVGKQLTRNGNNGGFVRRCSLNSSDALFTFDEDTVSDTERSHIDEIVSVFGFGSTFSTPVTLSSVHINQRNRRTQFNWQTATETFHLGFNLWGNMDGQWVQLNRSLITGKGSDLLTPQDYKKTIWLTRHQANTIQQFGLSSVDTSGDEEFFGPFIIGQHYGEQSIAEAIDWQETQQAFSANMRQKGYTLVNGRWRKVSKKYQQRLLANKLAYEQAVLNIRVTETGIYGISFQEVIDASSAWQNIPITDIALTKNGKPLPRDIISDDDTFNQGDHIIFVGSAPQESHATYLREQTYQLRLNPSNVRQANAFNIPPPDHSAPSDTAFFSKILTQNKEHTPTMPINDAWYDARIVSTGNPAQQSYSYKLNETQLVHLQDTTNSDGQLTVNLFGGIDLPGDPTAEPDHHVQILFNGTIISDSTFDGLQASSLNLVIPAALIKAENQIDVKLVGDTGKVADIVYVNDIEVAHYDTLQLTDYLSFAANKEADTYHVVNAPDDSRVYAYQSNGNLSHIQSVSFNDSQTNTALTFSAVPNQQQLDDVHYAIAQANDWLTPRSIDLTMPQDLTQQAAELLVIAHPNFINDDLTRYIEHKNKLGTTARVINWLDIIDTYGYGNDTPHALNHFLQLANASFDYKYVLLVGGHTYDYHNYSGQSVVNFIPSHYSRVGLFAKAPTDTPFVDLDHDGLPDKAIGRWPVRSAQDLSAIIDKSIQWQTNLSNNNHHDALLIADQSDSKGLNFKKSIIHHVGNALKDQTSTNQVSQIFIDDLLAQNTPNPLAVAQQNIINAINQGVNLVSFNGHGSPTSWTRNGLFNANTVAKLNNQGKPTVVLPLACYTTYYESLSINTLAHQWLFTEDKGAAAIHGAAVLGQYRENALFAERALKQQLVHRQTLGQSILSVKQSMAPWNEMVNNWTLLGDPSLPLR